MSEYKPINERDIKLLCKLGLDMQSINNVADNIRGEFILDESVFRPMCRLVEIVDMINESDNPAVMEQFGHLITLLELGKE